ncbi:hypothetical protein B0H11DRAFT_1905409 [Mycena galericulata]|nr:hypothetical protein B0H11DRAFT_1905409 [Mycena galericulata]
MPFKPALLILVYSASASLLPPAECRLRRSRPVHTIAPRVCVSDPPPSLFQLNSALTAPIQTAVQAGNCRLRLFPRLHAPDRSAPTPSSFRRGRLMGTRAASETSRTLPRMANPWRSRSDTRERNVRCDCVDDDARADDLDDDGRQGHTCADCVPRAAVAGGWRSNGAYSGRSAYSCPFIQRSTLDTPMTHTASASPPKFIKRLLRVPGLLAFPAAHLTFAPLAVIGVARTCTVRLHSTPNPLLRLRSVCQSSRESFEQDSEPPA